MIKRKEVKAFLSCLQTWRKAKCQLELLQVEVLMCESPEISQSIRNEDILTLTFLCVFVRSFGCSYPLTKIHRKKLHFCFSLEVLNKKTKQPLLTAGTSNHVTFRGPFQLTLIRDSIIIK